MHAWWQKSVIVRWTSWTLYFSEISLYKIRDTNVIAYQRTWECSSASWTWNHAQIFRTCSPKAFLDPNKASCAKIKALPSFTTTMVSSIQRGSSLNVTELEETTKHWFSGSWGGCGSVAPSFRCDTNESHGKSMKCMKFTATTTTITTKESNRRTRFCWGDSWTCLKSQPFLDFPLRPPNHTS